jgi:hypothetical protein
MKISTSKRIKYILKHKYYFLKIEYKLTNKITLSGILHDVDKIFMLLFTSKSVKEIQKIHRSKARHHANDQIKSEKDYIQMVIDWECARYSKPDKQLNARQTLDKFYPYLTEKVLPIIEKLKL